MKVYCTNPNCECSENVVPDEFLNLRSHKPRYCSSCRMDLILKTRYLPLEQIGWGGFGKTFRAWDSHLQQQCVVKQLRPRNPSGTPFPPLVLEKIKKSFEEEAKALRDFRHEQIPQLYDYFELPAPYDSQEESRQELFYLVQEYIQGDTLAEKLNKKILFLENDVFEVLRQLLDVLKYIHEKKGFIHRDIKLSNIICHEDRTHYLIDFGAAIKRELEPGVPVEQSMAMGTPIFAPPEQLAGRREVYPSSDLYSLAATCVCLLTSKNVNELYNQHQWIWREYAKASNHLADILDRMLLSEPSDRFQSAADVITALSKETARNQDTEIPSDQQTRETENSGDRSFPPTINDGETLPKPSFLDKFKRRFLKVPSLIGLGLLSLAIALFIGWSMQPHPICDFQNEDGFSCGETVLLPKNPRISSDIFAYKLKGTEAFQQEKFSEASQYFQNYLDANKNDPEARIYLNNAKAALTKKPLKIAAAVPIIDDPLNPSNALAEQILRGFAHVQYNLNQKNGINGRLLFIEIASYFRSSGKIKQVADAIVSKEDILGIFGYYTSDNMLEAAPSYDGKIAVISPTSTAVRDADFRLNNYVFRASPDNSAGAGKLVEYMVRQNLKKIAIFYQPSDKYTTSFIKVFKDILFQNQGQLVNECQVTQSSTEALRCLQQAKRSEAEVILLAFSDKVAEIAAIPIVNQSENITILGTDTLYIESVTQTNNPKLRITVRWHRSNGAKSKFEQESVKLWGTGDVNWRTAMSYDAAVAMVEGLKRSQGNLTRQRLYEELKKRDFSAEGVTAKVEFNDLGDRKPLPGIGVLVKVENNRFVVDETP
jgi:ABC-type branched-subunit amino acid transport system substrate-binding protein